MALKKWCNRDSQAIPMRQMSDRDWEFQYGSGYSISILKHRKVGGRPYATDVWAEWSAYLARVTWQLELTATFRNATSVHKVMKALRKVINYSAQKIFGRRFFRKGIVGIGWFAVIESHASGVPHVHALLVGFQPKELDRVIKIIQAEWGCRFGICECGHIRNLEAICKYFSKTLASKAEFEFSNNIGNWLRMPIAR